MRYLVSLWLLRAPLPGFPWATVTVNVLGSFLLCAIMQISATSVTMAPTLRLGLTAGVMGGFTTYSTFNFETMQFLDGGHFGMAVLYVVTTLFGCLLAGYLGTVAGRAMVGA